MSKLGSAGLYGEWDGDTITVCSKASAEVLATAVRKQDGLYHLQGMTHTDPQLTPAELDKRMVEMKGTQVRKAKEKETRLAAALYDLPTPMRYWIEFNLWFWGI
jgi:hypothetical protein